MRIAATLDIDEGSRVVGVIERAIIAAREAPDQSASFTSCGVTVNVRPDSSPRLIFDEFLRKLNGRLEGSVGPYPVDIPVEDLSVPRLRSEIETVLLSAPEIDVVNEEAWGAFVAQNVDNCGYGQSVVGYVERWARLMQVGLVEGRKIFDISDRASYEVDFDGMRPLVYQRALIELALHWKHGRDLRYACAYSSYPHAENVKNEHIVSPS